MSDLPRLNFPKCGLRIKDSERGARVWDELRKCWVVLTPEEWVRRHAVNFFVSVMRVPAVLIKQEFPVNIAEMNQRADIVIFKGAHPFMLVECKAAEVKIGQCALDQAVRYNSVVKARYIMLTNGLIHFIYELTDDNVYQPVKGLADIDFRF